VARPRRTASLTSNRKSNCEHMAGANIAEVCIANQQAQQQLLRVLVLGKHSLEQLRSLYSYYFNRQSTDPQRVLISRLSAH